MERISSNGTDFLSPAATISGQFQRVIPRGIHLTSQQLTWLFGFEKWNWIYDDESLSRFPLLISTTRFRGWAGGQSVRGQSGSVSITQIDHQTRPPDKTSWLLLRTRILKKKCVTNTLKRCQWTSHPNLTKPDEPSWLLLSVKVCKRPDLSRWTETIDY